MSQQPGGQSGTQLFGCRLASRLLQAHEATAYKKNFDFIGYLRPENDPGRVEELDGQLVQALAARELDDVYLAAPETLDWLELADPKANFAALGHP